MLDNATLNRAYTNYKIQKNNKSNKKIPVYLLTVQFARSQQFEKLQTLLDLYGDDELLCAAIIGFVEDRNHDKVEEYRSKFTIPVSIITQIYVKSSPESIHIPPFYRIANKLPDIGEIGERLNFIISRLKQGENSWSPYWIGSSEKLLAIINAIEKLENVSLLSEDNFQSSIEEAVNDEHSDLYRALNIPRISPITFLGQLGYKKCKSLMRAQDNHEAVVDSTIRQ